MILILNLSFDIVQPLLHHCSISVFVKQASKFFPWIPFQMKIHVPLKCERINKSMLIDLPSIDHFGFTPLLKVHYNFRIILRFLNNLN